MPGMRTSMITTSGLRRSASSTADAPSDASPTTRMCGARESDSRSPSRTTSWSSTISVGDLVGHASGDLMRLGGQRGQAVQLRVRSGGRQLRRAAGRGRRARARAAAPRSRTGSASAFGEVARRARTGARIRGSSSGQSRARQARKCSRVPGSQVEQVRPDAAGTRLAGGDDDALELSSGGRRARAGSAPSRRRRVRRRRRARESARRRCRGGAVPGSVVRQTSSSSVGTENVTETSARCDGLGEHVDVAHDHRPARDDRERVRGVAKHLEAAPREAVAALGRLVRIGRGADRDAFAAPARRASSRAEHLGDVHLDADRRAVAVVGRAVGALLERPHVTERAAVHAAHVRVERPGERHPLHAVQSATCRAPRGRRPASRR